MGNNLRIYIVIGTFLPWVGGAEKQALLQAASLRERGYETTILTFRHERDWLPRDTLQGVPIVRVAGPLLVGREKLPRVLQRLVFLLAIGVMGWTLWKHRQRYDLVHLYQLTQLTLPAAIVCWLTHKPLLVAVRCSGPDQPLPTSGNLSLLPGPLDPSLPYLNVEGHSRLDGDLEALERLGQPAVRFTRWLLKRIHATVVVLSSRMRAYLVTHSFALPGMQLIPNGVDARRFSPMKKNLPIEQQDLMVVCVSKMRYEKGIDVLLHAWRLVIERLPASTQARLVIVGDGPIQAQLEQLAHALGIAESVEFAGVQRDVPAYLCRGTVAILPSRWEGMPNAVLEAMACGLPCIATRVSGSEDIIQHGANGLLVEPEDYQGMAKALVTLLCDLSLAHKYGRAARETIEQKYALEHIIDVYEKLYQMMTGHEVRDVEETKIAEMSSLSS